MKPTKKWEKIGFGKTQILDMADKCFKAVVINMFKDLRETMIKRFREAIMQCPSKYITKEMIKKKKKETTVNSGVEKYHNQNEKFTRQMES